MTDHSALSPEDALALAIKRANGTSRLADLIGVTSQAISQWTRVPVERVLDVERETGVHRSAQRPDIYPPEDAPMSAVG